ncbi:MAG: outer membrane beta-barrel protein, partial [Bacteroidota bacterium]
MERIIQKIYLILGITVNWQLGAVSSPLDSFVVAESSVLRTTFSVKNPAYRQSAKRYGQDSSNTFTWSAYGEFYASIDAIEPRTNQNSLPFLVNHKQINNVGVNIALVRTHYSNGNTRANAGIMFGDYSRYNLGAEDMSLRNIYELNAGVKLLKNDNLWLDAGVFESYLGFESPLGVNNATLTRSMFAENSPYYLSGVRLQFTSRDSRILFSGYYLNGWQRMVRP